MYKLIDDEIKLFKKINALAEKINKPLKGICNEIERNDCCDGNAFSADTDMLNQEQIENYVGSLVCVRYALYYFRKKVKDGLADKKDEDDFFKEVQKIVKFEIN